MLALIFNLTYISTILFSLWLCWRVVKHKQPRLFVWAACGICLVNLPGQIGLISEGAMLLQLIFPIYLAILVGVDYCHWAFVVPFSLLIAFSHPLAALMLGSAALLALLERNRGVAAFMICLTVGAVIWFISGITPYESSILTDSALGTRFVSAVLGLPLLVLLLGWLAGLALLLPMLRLRWQLFARFPENLNDYAAQRLLTVAIIAGIIWALFPTFWIDALSYRFFLIPFTAPFMVAAWVDHRNPLPDQPSRQPILHRLATLFAAVMIVQSVWWLGFSTALRSTLASSPQPCLTANEGSLQWNRYTILNHWTITAYSLVAQGNTITAIVLPAPQCNAADFSQGFHVAEWDFRAWDRLWLDAKPLADRLISSAADAQ
jgi:hypothetical protein